MKSKLKTLLQKTSVQVGIILTVTLICYANILPNGYAFDDQYITENKYVLLGIDGLYDIWTHPFIELGNLKVDYRPISLTLYSLEHLVFGSNPMVSHLISIVFYLITLLLLYRVSIQVFKVDRIHPLLPFLIILLYGVHPSHTEVVASLKNRDELLSFSLMLIATLYFDKCFRQPLNRKLILYVVLTFLFFYLSQLTKLIALPFMACLFLWTLYTKQFKNYTVFFILLTGFIVITGLHMYSIFEYIDRSANIYENPLTKESPFDMRLGLGFNSLLFYLKFMVLPFPFRFYYGYDVISYESISQPMPLFSFLIYALLCGLLLYSILKKKTYSYFLFAFLFMAFLYSNILIGPYPGIVSERSMFQFSYFFIAFILIAVSEFSDFQTKTKGHPSSKMLNIKNLVYLCFLIFFSLLTIRRNFEWKDNHTLMLKDMQYLKKSAMGNYIAAVNFNDKSLQLQKEDTLESRKWAELAVYYYHEAIRITPERRQVYYMLGKTYRYSLSDLNQAEKYYLIAAEKNSDVPGLARELASLYFIKQEYSKAIAYYDHAVEEQPEDAELDFYRALNMFNAKNTDQFLKLNAESLKKFPATQYPYLNYGTYYFNRNETEKVAENFEKAIQYGCDNPQVINFMIQYYSGKNNTEKAAYYSNLLK